MIDYETQRRKKWISEQSAILDADTDFTIRGECLYIRQEVTRTWLSENYTKTQGFQKFAKRRHKRKK